MMTTLNPAEQPMVSDDGAFTYPFALRLFTLREKDFVRRMGTADCALVGAIVFNATHDRVLLVQRSAGDSLPGKWEVPGGMCEHSDNSILHAAVRELFEESGLELAAFRGWAGTHFFSLGGDEEDKSIQAAKYLFAVETRNHDVQLNDREHQNFIWATEQEVQACKYGGEETIEFTSEILKYSIKTAFTMIRSLYA
ncbi:NUDIX hydrolase domain-like protein [Biscogniauxia mediterranea]|nr:NUDIX hydrolase domain-like protein [Biscogniauxia mediterranea]